MEDIKEEISFKERKKLPKEAKKAKYKVLFKNLCIAVAITAYFTVLNLGARNIESNIFVVDLQVFSIALLAISIILFERGYKKDNESIFFNGIEVLFVALITLFMPYMIWYENSLLTILFELGFIFFIAYYFIKSVIQTKKIKKQYAPSDVRELVKKEKNGEN